MRFLSFSKTLFTVVFIVFFTSNSFSQEHKTSIIQDSRFTDLLNEKRKMNAAATGSDRFRIQIFSGDNEKCKKAFYDFKKSYKDIDRTIVFKSPIYKVLVGNFKTRLDAERVLMELKKKYPNALLVRPN
jgi:hypothetical protein